MVLLVLNNELHFGRVLDSHVGVAAATPPAIANGISSRHAGFSPATLKSTSQLPVNIQGASPPRDATCCSTVAE
jgi:hypothetical protein